MARPPREELRLPGLTLDLGRARRLGHGEVVFGEGKAPEALAAALGALHAETGFAFATRVDAAKAAATAVLLPGVVHDAEARVLRYGEPPAPRGRVCVLSAGTSDAPVAAEAAAVARCLGLGVTQVEDVGVAGLHRLLAREAEVGAADVLVVVAGMDGALPSVVAGLWPQPVVAVPTSVGYGAAFGGLAPLLTMLNACAPGVVVVNIDNGFGAAYAAARLVGGRS